MNIPGDSSQIQVMAVASLLNPEADKTTHALWMRLEKSCGLRGIRLTPTPHFSWLVAKQYQTPEIIANLKAIANEMTPFKVRTSGLGIFTGSDPVIYLPLVKTRSMLTFHERLNELIMPCSIEPNPYYTPDRWVPHVTLATKDVDPENLACAVSGMIDRQLDIEITVDHLALLYAIDGQVGLAGRFDFEG